MNTWQRELRSRGNYLVGLLFQPDDVIGTSVPELGHVRNRSSFLSTGGMKTRRVQGRPAPILTWLKTYFDAPSDAPCGCFGVKCSTLTL